MRTLALGCSKTIYALISAYYVHQFLLFHTSREQQDPVVALVIAADEP